jgi:hypothetical protein
MPLTCRSSAKVTTRGGSSSSRQSTASPGVFTQGECGSTDPHDDHDFDLPTSLDEMVERFGFDTVYTTFHRFIDEQEQR